MFYTIYKITNLLDGKIYIGKHQTKDLNDGYMGSGKQLKHVQTKHGIENFKKEILFQFDNETDMNAKEAELVTEEFCLREDTYNLCPGGKGGWGYINNNNILKMHGKTQSIRQKTAASEILIKYNKSPEGRTRASKGRKDSFSGKKHTNDTKRKIGKSNSIKQSGNNNSQFGTMWITTGTLNKKIKKEDLIPEGWYKGRKCHDDSS
jgi:hypothetical protein